MAYGPGPSQRFDVYAAAGPPPERPAPLAVLIHGGGWESGSRQDMLDTVPVFASRGYAVANLGYRLTSEAAAPAAVEDVRQAIAAVRSRASEWGADGGDLTLVGFSAGGHLALLAALAPETVLAGPQCRAQAIVSFWGISDVADLLEGAHARDFARHWLAATPGPGNARQWAEKLSPLRYSAAGAPALCAVHSIHDDIVPFAHSQRLVAQWRSAGSRAGLIELTHPGHAAPPGDYRSIFAKVFRCLERQP